MDISDKISKFLNENYNDVSEEPNGGPEEDYNDLC